MPYQSLSTLRMVTFKNGGFDFKNGSFNLKNGGI